MAGKGKIYFNEKREGGIGLFYMGQLTTGAGSTIVTRINSLQAIVGSETTVGTRTGYNVAGAAVKNIGLFYGGFRDAPEGGYSKTDWVIRINAEGVMVGTETAVGHERNYLGSAGLDTLGLFYGNSSSGPEASTVVRISDEGTLVSVPTSIDVGRVMIKGTGWGSYGLFWGGGDSSDGTNSTDSILINENGTKKSQNTTVGKMITLGTSTRVSNTALFFGPGEESLVMNRVAGTGALLSTMDAIGEERLFPSGATAGDYGLFYGGATSFSVSSMVSTIARYSENGAMVGVESSVGTARAGHTGASLVH